MHPLTGRVISGRYSLTEPIGRGAMGVVWRARDELLDRDVAVKEVLVAESLDEDERETAYQRTLREARTAARLSHRGLVTIYDVAEEDGRPWIVMELVDAPSLDQIIETDGPLTPRRAGVMAQQLLAALAAAHAAGVLHRDVKPSNVLLAKDDRAVLTDFGIATFQGDPRLTQTGMVMGSPGFTAPERIRGGSATPASDLWSLGATLYAAVEGAGPYERRGGAITTMSAVINEDAPEATSAGQLGEIISALLRRDPSARPDAVSAVRTITKVLPELPDSRDGSAVQAQVSVGSTVAEAMNAPAVPATRPGEVPKASFTPRPGVVPARNPVPDPPTAPQPEVGFTADPADSPVASASPPAPAPRRSPRRSWRIAIAVLVAAAAAAGGGYAAFALRHRSAPPAVGEVVRQQTPNPLVTAINDPAAGTPLGYQLFMLSAADAGTVAGFQIDTPATWSTVRSSARRSFFYAPLHQRFLNVDLTTHTYPDMLTEAEHIEAGQVARGKFPGYRRITMERTQIRGFPAAIWEFSWQNSAGIQMHGADLLFIAKTAAGDQSYALFMVAPERAWLSTMRTFARELRTFQVASLRLVPAGRGLMRPGAAR